MLTAEVFTVLMLELSTSCFDRFVFNAAVLKVNCSVPLMFRSILLTTWLQIFIKVPHLCMIYHGMQMQYLVKLRTFFSRWLISLGFEISLQVLLSTINRWSKSDLWGYSHFFLVTALKYLVSCSCILHAHWLHRVGCNSVCNTVIVPLRIHYLLTYTWGTRAH